MLTRMLGVLILASLSVLLPNDRSLAASIQGQFVLVCTFCPMITAFCGPSNS
jgi:hypothetical protein